MTISHAEYESLCNQSVKLNEIAASYLESVGFDMNEEQHRTYTMLLMDAEVINEQLRNYYNECAKSLANDYSLGGVIGD